MALLVNFVKHKPKKCCKCFKHFHFEEEVIFSMRLYQGRHLILPYFQSEKITHRFWLQTWDSNQRQMPLLLSESGQPEYPHDCVSCPCSWVPQMEGPHAMNYKQEREPESGESTGGGRSDDIKPWLEIRKEWFWI